MALVESQSSNLSRAAVLAGRAVELDPNNADAQFLLARILSKVGKPEKAIVHWKLALAADPDATRWRGA